jgi:P-type conjugative transfer ATPase TrbB
MTALTPQQQSRQRVLSKLADELGPDLCRLRDDPDVIEIQATRDGHVWTDRLSVGKQDTGLVLPAPQREMIIRTVAAWHGLVANRTHPLLKAEVPPDGARFQGFLPPVSPPGFVIRRPFNRILSLEEFVADGSITAWQAEVLRTAIDHRQKILIAGGTLSGKTVLCNSGVAEMIRQRGPGVRVVMIEDTLEMTAPPEATNFEHLHTTDDVSLRPLIQMTMRLSPECLIVGEMRGAEALDIIKVWMSGHGASISTIQADNKEEALWKFESYVEEAGVKPNPRMIGHVVNLIITMERDRVNHWRVKEMARVEGWNGQQYMLSVCNPFEEVSHEAFVSVNGRDHSGSRGQPESGLGGQLGLGVGAQSHAAHQRVYGHPGLDRRRTGDPLLGRPLPL